AARRDRREREREGREPARDSWHWDLRPDPKQTACRRLVREGPVAEPHGAPRVARVLIRPGPRGPGVSAGSGAKHVSATRTCLSPHLASPPDPRPRGARILALVRAVPRAKKGPHGERRLPPFRPRGSGGPRHRRGPRDRPGLRPSAGPRRRGRGPG